MQFLLSVFGRWWQGCSQVGWFPIEVRGTAKRADWGEEGKRWRTQWVVSASVLLISTLCSCRIIILRVALWQKEWKPVVRLIQPLTSSILTMSCLLLKVFLSSAVSPGETNVWWIITLMCDCWIFLCCIHNLSLKLKISGCLSFYLHTAADMFSVLSKG